MKDEYAEKVPHSCNGLMAKTYAVNLDESETKKRKRFQRVFL